MEKQANKSLEPLPAQQITTSDPGLHAFLVKGANKNPANGEPFLE
jgi:hypothetical protein